MSKLLSVTEFADAVGLAPKTIRQWVWMRRVPYVRVGRAIRFKPETAQKIIDRGTVPALERRFGIKQHKTASEEGNRMPELKKTRMLTLSQAAEALGISVNTIRVWIWRREIDYVKIGRSVRVTEATVQRIIDSGTIPALEERR